MKFFNIGDLLVRDNELCEIQDIIFNPEKNGGEQVLMYKIKWLGLIKEDGRKRQSGGYGKDVITVAYADQCFETFEELGYSEEEIQLIKRLYV